MSKKIFAFTAFLLIFSTLFSSISFASGFDVSIDRVTVNGQPVSESKSNLINDANSFSVIVEFTAVSALQGAHVEAVLRGRQSSDVVSDATGNFDLAKGQNSIALLTLALTDGLKRENEFDLTIKIVDVRGNSEEKSYGIKTKRTTSRGALDVSIDRVKVNDRVVASSRTNFIEESNDFDVLVEFTALEDLEDAHVEAVLKDLNSGNVVADASPNFNLAGDTSSSELLRLNLLDKLKDSNSFELIVRIVDSEGDSVQKVYGITMRDGGKFVSGGGRALDISIDSVELENDVVAENENNFVIIGEGKKKVDLRVRLTALENIKDAHVDAVLAFENGDVVADATTTFDIGKNENTARTLELPLIGRFEQNSFKLKVKVVDAEGDSEEKVYGLKISQKKFPFVISSIALSPEDNVEAGKNLIAKLSFKNSGVVPLDGISAKVSIQELGVSSAKFIDQIKNSGNLAEIKEDFILKIPDTAPAGTYTVRAEITSQFGGESEVREIPVSIAGQSGQANQVANDRLVINVPTVKQDILNDGSESVYPIILTNQGKDANAYTLLLDGANWASLRLSDSSAFVINPKESKTINIFASSKGDAAGEQIFLVTVQSNEKVLKQLPLKGNVVPAKGTLADSLKNLLWMLLIGFVVLLVAMGAFFGVRKIMMNGGEVIPEHAEETYY